MDALNIVKIEDATYCDNDASAAAREQHVGDTSLVMDDLNIVKIEDATYCDNDASAAREQHVGDTSTTRQQTRKTSAIWKYFTICDDDVTKVACSICKRVVGRGKNLKHLTTSNMHNHMQYKHRIVAGIRGAPSSSRRSQPTSAAPARASEARDRPSRPTTQTITDSVGEMISVDLLPYTFVENRGFRKLLRVVAPRYTLPAGVHFSHKVVPQLHQRVASKVIERLAGVEGDVVHCTADIWTRKFSPSSYLSLTGHWIVRRASGGAAATRERAGALLGMKVVDAASTPAEILQHLLGLVEEWRAAAPRRFAVGFVVTNNTSDMAKVVAGGGFEHVRCAAHSIHLIVTGAIQECRGVAAAVDAARRITNSVHMSTKAVAKLRQMQERLGLAEAALTRGVPTRWTAVLFMLRRLLEQKEALVGMSAEADLGGSVAEPQWTLMEAVVKVLEPFEEATRTLCRDDASVSSVIPCIQALRAALGELLASEDVSDLSETRKLVGSLQSRLEEHFQHVFDSPTNAYFKATLLDPRFKSMPVALLSRRDFERLKAAVTAEVDELLERDRMLSSGDAGSSSDAAPEDAGSKPPSLFWGAMQSLVANNAATLSKSVTSLGLETYLAESRPQALASDPVSSYWSAKMAQHPTLARVAVKYLACPPTSVSSERLLSTGGDAVAPDYRLLPVDVPQLVFTKYNLAKFR